MKAAVMVIVVAVALPAAASGRSELPAGVSPGSPSGTVVADPCPTFSWGGTEGADSYEIVVYRGPEEGEAEPILVERVPGAASSWTPPLGRCLEPGGSYAWSVRAGGAGGASEWSEPLLFQVAPGPSEEEFQRALLVVERYLGTREAPEEEPGSASAAAEGSARTRAEPSLEPRALGGADFSIDSSGNVAGLSFTGDGSGLANVTAVDLVGGACVSEAELDFAVATDAELAVHAGVASAHHAPTVDTTCSGVACDGALFTNLQWGALAGVPAGFADSIDDACTVTDNGNGTATLACGDGSGVTWYLTKAVAVSAGDSHTCVLLAGGSVVCWGGDESGQSSPPSGIFSEISAGGSHTCAVRSGGSVACWGYDGYGQASPPAGSFSQVEAGSGHTCGVRSDGAVACWGWNGYGQAVPPAGTFSQVSGGLWHTCGVQSGGSVACWGSNSHGQSAPPAGTFRQVSAGLWHTCGLQSDGSVACWGDDTYGQATPPSGTFSQVSAGSNHTCGVQSDDSVACWGDDTYGQATPPAGTFRQVSAGFGHTCGVQSGGSVACWGDDASGQCDVPSPLE